MIKQILVVGFSLLFISTRWLLYKVEAKEIEDYSSDLSKAYELEEKEFARLDMGSRYFKKGMEESEVLRILGEPDRKNEKGGEIAFWSYATSVSGTDGWDTVFIKGKLDFWGTAQTTWLGTCYRELSPLEKESLDDWITMCKESKIGLYGPYSYFIKKE